MVKIIAFIISVLLFPGAVALSQDADSLNTTDGAIRSSNNHFVYTKETNFTVRSYCRLLATDLLGEVTGPFHTSKREWIRVGEFAILESSLVMADKSIQSSVTTFTNPNPGVKTVSKIATNFGSSYEIATLAAFEAYGSIFKNDKLKTVTLLATQSLITSSVMVNVIKAVIGRKRPSAFDELHEDNLSFLGPGVNSVSSSFPSGHSTAAFSVATVFAEEYKDNVAIPIISYSAATLVGLSRITENAHWASDVLAGVALGYVTGKLAVRNYHRYMRSKSEKQKTALLFYLGYNNGILMPSMIYRF
jgi:membrane-associated phospholipid phosphatase